jgi:hypothetical protein
MPCLSARDQVSHPLKNTQNYNFYSLILIGYNCIQKLINVYQILVYFFAARFG